MKIHKRIRSKVRKFIPSKKGKILELDGKIYIKDFIKYLPSTKIQKRALISYLVQPMLEDLRDIPTIQFTSNGTARGLVKVVNQIGYAVDIIDWDNTTYIPDTEYDLIILHGGKNTKNLISKLKPNGKIIYYSTGAYWKWHNKQEKLRYDNFYFRHKRKISYDRFIGDSEEKANSIADGIVCLGNSDLKNTYKKFSEVHNFPGAAYPKKNFSIVKKNYAKAKYNFLFFAGPGNIHKGLDLLLDAFKNTPELNLYVCGFLDKEFSKYYRHELFNLSNIKTYGFIRQRGTKFKHVVKKCGFIIFPSCSEGSPGSVIEAMHYGLVPIVSKESHIDVSKDGYVLDKCTVESVKKLIREAAMLSDQSLQSKSIKIKELAESKYTINEYEKNLKTAIQKILNHK